MGSRQQPTICPHGYTVDWGDYGDDDETEPCPTCDAVEEGDVNSEELEANEIGDAPRTARRLAPRRLRAHAPPRSQDRGHLMRSIDMGMAYRCDGCGDHYCGKHLIHQVCGYCADPTPGENWVYDR